MKSPGDLFEQAARVGLSRRRFLALAARGGAVAALGGVAAACTNGSSSSSTGSKAASGTGVRISEYVPGPQPVSGGKRGGQLVAGYVDAAVNFDPAVGGGSLTDYDAIAGLITSGGWYAMDKQFGGPVPNLASSLPEVSADGKTLTIRFRSGVKFHNGRVIEMEDYKYSVERMLRTKTSWGPTFYQNIEGWTDIVHGKTKNLEGLEIKDSHTLVIHLTAPQADIVSALALNVIAPVPKEEVDRWGDNFGTHTVSFGPYKLESFSPQGQHAVFTKFDDYFYEGLPYLDKVEQRWGIEQALLMNLIQGGQLDVAPLGFDSFLRQALGDPSLKQSVVTRPEIAENFVTLIPQNLPLLKNASIRQALNWSVDRSLISKITAGAEVGYGFPFPAGNNVPFTGQPFGFDLAKAKQLLATAGVPNGFSAVMGIVGGGDTATLAQFLQQQWAAIGVKLTLKTFTADGMSAAAAAGDVHMSISHWVNDYPDPSDVISFLYVDSARFPDPRVTTLWKQADSEYDVHKRYAIYAQIEQELMNLAPAIFLSTPVAISGVGSRINNFHFRGDTGTYFDRMWVE